MGTSTKYEAPTSEEWRNLKTKVTKLVTQDKSSPTDIRKITHEFVTINEGWIWVTNNSESTERGQAALRIAQKIGAFFSLVADHGFSEAFKQANLGLLEDHKVREIKNLLLVYLGGHSNMHDEVDARNGLSNLLNEILNDADPLEKIEETMETRSDSKPFVNMLRYFFAYYLYAQFRRMFYEGLVRKVKTLTNADEDANKIVDEKVSKIRISFFGAVKDIIDKDTNQIDWEVNQITWCGKQGWQIVYEILQEIREALAYED